MFSGEIDVDDHRRVINAHEQQGNGLQSLAPGQARRGEGARIDEQCASMLNAHGDMGVAEDDDRCAGAPREGGAPVELGSPGIVAARRHFPRVVRVVSVAQQQPPAVNHDRLPVRQLALRVVAIVIAVHGDDGGDRT